MIQPPCLDSVTSEDRRENTAQPGSSLTRRYVGPAGQQLHLLESGQRTGRPLYCLHATAYSGRSLAPFLEIMGLRRRTVAIDAPGYGGSDPPAVHIGIEGYSAAIAAALDQTGETQVDLLGYHTGALVAAELARQRPDVVSSLVLIGVPFFAGFEQTEWRRRLAHPMRLSENLGQFQERWDYLVGNRPPGVSLTRSFDNFVDELRAYPNGWWAHEAAFTFDVERCFARVSQPALVLNPRNHLSAASRQAAAALANGRLVEMPHLENGIFDVAPVEIAEAIDGFLSEVRP